MSPAERALAELAERGLFGFPPAPSRNDRKPSRREREESDSPQGKTGGAS